MKKFTINRSKWRTGTEGSNKTGIGDTFLLNNEGFMCCLGFYSIQAGFGVTDCLNEPYARNIVRKRKDKADSFKKLEMLVHELDGEYYHSAFATEAMGINDNKTIPEQKEIEIKELFAKEGVEVEFYGEFYKPNQDVQQTV